jgi:hypothetical protein
VNFSQDTDEGNPNRLRWLLAFAALLFIPVAIIWWPGCRQYPTATSAESMKLIKLLYTACNTKDAARLKHLEQRVEKAAQGGQLTATEQESFARIISLARDGSWQAAEKAAFRFAQDQVGRGHAAPHSDDDHRKTRPSAKSTSKR